MQLSISVPVLNEAAQIQHFLRHLRAHAPQAEIIVVDGGSHDDTPALAAGLCDRLLTTDRSRPCQMNAGARLAQGGVLWFLHVDCEVPDGGPAAIENSLRDTRVVGGCFRVRIRGPEWIYRIHDGLAHYVGRILHVRCGDHGIFVRRHVFENVGGYPDVPLMEDVELFRAIHATGKVAWLPNRLLLSARRHEQVGVYRYTFICAFIVALYCLGVNSWRLAGLYQSLVPPRGSGRNPWPMHPVEPALLAPFHSGCDLPCQSLIAR